eukprot:m.119882 g.119882  ORF g.119882 m.119882 type:complete len:159 (+) comp16163_c1_seq1:57-533(+)
MANKSEKRMNATNKAVLEFFLRVVGIALALSLLLRLFVCENGLSGWRLLSFLWNSGSMGVMYVLLLKSADANTDLSLADSISVYMQDIIYVAAGVSVLSCLSEYFNFLVFGFCGFKIWSMFIGPWLASRNAPTELSEADKKRADKKQRQQERLQKFQR